MYVANINKDILTKVVAGLIEQTGEFVERFELKTIQDGCKLIVETLEYIAHITTSDTAEEINVVLYFLGQPTEIIVSSRKNHQYKSLKEYVEDMSNRILKEICNPIANNPNVTNLKWLIKYSS